MLIFNLMRLPYNHSFYPGKTSAHKLIYVLLKVPLSYSTRRDRLYKPSIEEFKQPYLIAKIRSFLQKLIFGPAFGYLLCMLDSLKIIGGITLVLKSHLST
jgi:hypothetical protein